MEAKPQHPAALDIIVVGAGISGLATAISCSLSGHRVTIFEAAKELAEVRFEKPSPNQISLIERCLGRCRLTDHTECLLDTQRMGRPRQSLEASCRAHMSCRTPLLRWQSPCDGERLW